MKKLIYLLSILIVFACGNISKSDSSDAEVDTTDYIKLEQRAYKSGYAYGSDDASDGKPYLTSFNPKSAYDLWGTKKQSQTWAKGCRRGYDDGYNEGKAALQEGNSSGIKYHQETITYTETPNTYSSTPDLNNGNAHSNERIYSHLSNYEETDDCVEGVVVYEGKGDYYIVETRRGYTVLERYNGRLDEGDKVRGELNKYKYKYLYNRNKDSEVKVYIEDYMLSDEKALEWMGENEHLKSRDQEAYDYNKDN